MSNNRFEWQGLTELRSALRELPDDLARDAGPIVAEAAEGAQRDTQIAYPSRTGNLRAGVKVDQQVSSRFGAAARVKSTAPHANIFERGTGPRQTRQGWNRGRMPEAPEHQKMIPIVIKHRRRMFEGLKDLVRRAGFLVE